MPLNTVKVTRPGRWGNPFRAEGAYSAIQAIADFKANLLANDLKVRDAVVELRGKNLACWCGLDQPCHADVLLEIVRDDGSLATEGSEID